MKRLLLGTVIGLVILVVSLLTIQGLQAYAATPLNTFVFGATNPVRTMDPQDSLDNLSWRGIYYCYDGLVKYKGNSTEIEPSLAQSWDISSDGKTYTFHLRQGVKFVDDTPFNAAAVKFSFDRLLKLGKAAGGMFRGLLDPESIKAVDEFTVQFELNYPFAPFIGTLATDEARIVSPGIMKHEANSDYAQAWLSANSDGTGPFYLTAENWHRGAEMIFKRNEKYWGSMPRIDTVIIKYVPDASVLRDMLEKGDVDMAETLSSDDLENLRSTPGIKVFEAPSLGLSYLYMNEQKKYLSNSKVRQAISWAIDYKNIIQAVKLGHAVQARGPIPTGMWGHDDTVFQYHRDLDRAKQLLKEAGYPNGFEIGLLIEPRPDWVTIASIVQANLADIGIKVKIESFARPTMRDKLGKGDFDMATGGWSPDFPDATEFAYYWFYSKLGGLAGNRSFYTNPRMDVIAQASRQVIDPTQRLKLFSEIQKLAVSDAVYIYLYQPDYEIAMRDNVKNYIFNPMLENMPNFDSLYKE